jgi:dolichyl-phosphate beta-glucosyltransferase
MLAGTLERVRAWVDVPGTEREALVVDDGCTDGSSDELLRLAHPKIRVLAHRPNRGKGAAVRTGMRAALGLRRAFVDVGAAYPLGDVERVFEALAGGADVVIGSRGHPESRYVVTTHGIVGLAARHLFGRGFNLCARWLATPDVRDTQAGLKGFSAAAAERLFSLATIDGFAFDVEILYLARRLGYRVTEVPVNFAYEREPSTLHLFRDAFRMFGETVRLRRRAKRGGYGPLPPPA